jgi:hypothetical protein
MINATNWKKEYTDYLNKELNSPNNVVRYAKEIQTLLDMGIDFDHLCANIDFYLRECKGGFLTLANKDGYPHAALGKFKKLMEIHGMI